MEIFINETSLNSQYPDQYKFIESLKLFLSSIKRLDQINKNKNVFQSNFLYSYTGFKNTHLQSVLKNDKELNLSFNNNIQKINPKKWEDNQVHDCKSSYKFNNDDYVKTSVAELSERKSRNKMLIGFLLNFEDSQFGNTPTISILKDSVHSIEVDCAVTPESIDNWLKENGLANDVYDENSKKPPRDYQTVLIDTAYFERTNYGDNQGRVVYRKIGTKELWTVDNFHYGKLSHIEVFDENTGKHLGISLYNQISLDVRFKDKNKTIDI